MASVTAAPALKKLADLGRADLGDRMSQWSVRRKVQRGEIPHVRIAGRIFIEESVLQGLLRGRAVPATKETAQGR